MSLRYLTHGGCLTGEIIPPGDKSISHRAIIFGAIANGVTQVDGLLTGHDVLATRDAFAAMGVTFIQHGDSLTIHGVGMHGLQPPDAPLNLGNSGTSMRLLTGLLAAQPFVSTLIGDESLSKRPMRRVVDPLLSMGATITTDADGTAPLTIDGHHQLTAITYEMPIASAQVKSCLLLAGLYAHGTTKIIEPGVSRDHSERMLQAFGVNLAVQANQISMAGGQALTATNLSIPADISSAAFFIVGALIAPGSTLLIKQVGVNPSRIGVITILKMMGASIEFQNERFFGREPVCDLLVSASQLHGIEIPVDQVPLAIDEFPAIFIAAACAQGDTILRGAKELRVKESDRIAAMAAGLTTLGIEVEEYPDGIRISGGTIHGGRVESVGDHRIAMSFAIAGLVATGPIEIMHCENVATSFPGFVALSKQAGLVIEENELESA